VSTDQPTLVQFRFSHYNEKARWALDYKGVAHRKRILIPGFHKRTLRRLGAKTTPYLIHGDTGYGDSTDIIAALENRYPDPALYPADLEQRQQALQLEDLFDEKLGPQVRSVIFFLALAHPEYFAATFAGHRSSPIKWMYSCAITLIRSGLKKDMNLVLETFEKDLEEIHAVLARIEKQLDGGDYLVGNCFSVADLTGAALLSPLCLPAESPDLPVGKVPAVITSFVKDLEEQSKVLDWAREMYRRHRPVA